MMQSNTLSGTTAAGDAFNIYFLPGGTATYEDATGMRDGGGWHIDKEAGVCVARQNPADRQEGCCRSRLLAGSASDPPDARRD